MAKKKVVPPKLEVNDKEVIYTLHEVSCTNADSCLSYALKRVGLHYTGFNGEDVLRGAEKTKLTNLKSAEVGSIILRVTKLKTIYKAMSIDIFGLCASKKMLSGIHFYVVERNNIWSDFGWEGIRLTEVDAISIDKSEFYEITIEAMHDFVINS